MTEVQINADNAMRQAIMTADDYLSKAYEILKKDYEDWTIRDAIELAKIMAIDFNTTMMCMKIQEIRDSIIAMNKDDNYEN